MAKATAKEQNPICALSKWVGDREQTNLTNEKKKKKDFPDGLFFSLEMEKETEKTEPEVEKQIESKIVTENKGMVLNCLFCNCRALCICI